MTYTINNPMADFISHVNLLLWPLRASQNVSVWASVQRETREQFTIPLRVHANVYVHDDSRYRLEYLD